MYRTPDGIGFDRLRDGSVRVQWRDFGTILDSDTCVCIVAAMSCGDDAQRELCLARALHMGHEEE